jgi:hypothetical protein
MSWMVKQLFPTPPPPTTTSLYSRRNCDDHGQQMSWVKRQRCTVARGEVPMALTGGRRWSMHTFDAISEDEVVRGERMRRARAFHKSRETQSGGRCKGREDSKVVVVGEKEWSARQAVVGWWCCVCCCCCRRPRLEWTWYAEDVCMRVLVWCWCDAREVTMWRATSGREGASISRGGDQGPALTNIRLGGSGTGGGKTSSSNLPEADGQEPKRLGDQPTRETRKHQQEEQRMSVSTVVQTA